MNSPGCHIRTAAEEWVFKFQCIMGEDLGFERRVIDNQEWFVVEAMHNDTPFEVLFRPDGQFKATAYTDWPGFEMKVTSDFSDESQINTWVDNVVKAVCVILD